LDDKVFNIIDARCNHEVLPVLFLPPQTAHWYFASLWKNES